MIKNRTKLLVLLLALAAGLASWWAYAALIMSGKPAPPPVVATSSGNGATATYQAEEKSVAPGAAASPAAPPAAVQATDGQGGALSYQVRESQSAPCPAVDSYIVREAEVRAGQSTALSWATTGGESATITDLLSKAVTRVPVNGNMPVSPATSRSYRLTVSAPCGVKSMDVRVTVKSGGK